MRRIISILCVLLCLVLLTAGCQAKGSFEKSDTYKNICSQIMKSFSDYSPEISYDAESEIIYIKITAPAGTAGAIANKAEEVKPVWDDFCKSMNEFSLSVQNMCKEDGYETVSAAVSILNDLNPDNTLYSVVNGIVVYNAWQ